MAADLGDRLPRPAVVQIRIEVDEDEPDVEAGERPDARGGGATHDRDALGASEVSAQLRRKGGSG